MNTPVTHWVDFDGNGIAMLVRSDVVTWLRENCKETEKASSFGYTISDYARKLANELEAGE